MQIDFEVKGGGEGKPREQTGMQAGRFLTYNRDLLILNFNEHNINVNQKNLHGGVGGNLKDTKVTK
jgi:hypothetical protein